VPPQQQQQQQQKLRPRDHASAAVHFRDPEKRPWRQRHRLRFTDQRRGARLKTPTENDRSRRHAQTNNYPSSRALAPDAGRPGAESYSRLSSTADAPPAPSPASPRPFSIGRNVRLDRFTDRTMLSRKKTRNLGPPLQQLRATPRVRDAGNSSARGRLTKRLKQAKRGQGRASRDRIDMAFICLTTE
jgi:hypothetical protein